MPPLDSEVSMMEVKVSEASILGNLPSFFPFKKKILAEKTSLKLWIWNS